MRKRTIEQVAEDARKIVESWPDWKRNAVRQSLNMPLLPNKPSPLDNIECLWYNFDLQEGPIWMLGVIADAYLDKGLEREYDCLKYCEKYRLSPRREDVYGVIYFNWRYYYNIADMCFDGTCNLWQGRFHSTSEQDEITKRFTVKSYVYKWLFKFWKDWE